MKKIDKTSLNKGLIKAYRDKELIKACNSYGITNANDFYDLIADLHEYKEVFKTIGLLIDEERRH